MPTHPTTPRTMTIVTNPPSEVRDELARYVSHPIHQQRGHAMSDHLWLDLVNADNDRLVGAAVHDAHGQIGYAQYSATTNGGVVESIVGSTNTPLTTPDELAIRRDLIDTLVTAVDNLHSADDGGITWWVDHQEDVELGAEFGFVQVRQLLEMRRSLPLDRSSSITTRAFCPDCDEAAWLRVNNRAFAGHGEQGGWTLATLQQRLDEPWFTPAGFRIAEQDGEMVGFCWTKIHPTDPPLGEIYVIAVDPAFHGQGLGTQLTLAGLDWLATAGLSTASLYVDHDNTAAVATYERLGFVPVRSRYALERPMPSRTS